MSPMTQSLVADHLYRPGGWASPGYMTVSEQGVIDTIGAAPPRGWSEDGAVRVHGFVVPGVPNLHSHAFQRVIAGRTEIAGSTEGSFWTWRTKMYELAARISPEDLEAVAAWLYVEMLKSGMTAVGEFHYLHHPPEGGRYNDVAELSARILAAGRSAGIAVTLLPVLYLHGGFGERVEGQQQRFSFDSVAEYLAFHDKVRAHASGSEGSRVGVAPHSLRAVSVPELQELLSGAAGLANCPVHVHIAEQKAEVEDCVAHTRRRPVEHLFDGVPVDQSWCLVHATHTLESELSQIAASGAVVGLCPITEADLGDGVFPAGRFLELGGRLGIGSDSNVVVDAAQELRLLEYGQRLTSERRNVLAGDSELDRHVGRHLFRRALAGGAQALAQPIGELEVGQRADFCVLDPEALIGHGPETAIDSWVFASSRTPVRDVAVGGRFVVRDYRHFDEDRLRSAFVATCGRLLT